MARNQKNHEPDNESSGPSPMSWLAFGVGLVVLVAAIGWTSMVLMTWDLFVILDKSVIPSALRLGLGVFVGVCAVGWMATSKARR
jgi:hypothetical protein